MAPASRRRTRDQDSEDSDSTISSQDSKRSKRRRLNEDAPSEFSDDDDNDVLPDSFRRSPRANRVNGAVPEKHQPGSLVRITVKNFVTYTKATFNCGPSLNMIIGPNGTGKSTLVCAICLGLGYKPNVLGRAKDIGEFVKHGNREAEIEVELAGHEGRTNPVIHHTIKREGNKSTYKINGTTVSHKEVMALVRSFSIQIDNLCQFLPQDRVVEFAQMTPVGLLESTQKAAAGEEMTAMHQQLKEQGAQRIKMKADFTESKGNLENLEKRQAAQQVDVDRMRERAGLLTRQQALEMCRPPLKYQIEKQKWDQMKEEKAQYAEELENLKRQVEPNLREVKRKEDITQKLEASVKEAKTIVEGFDRVAESKGEAVGEMQERLNNCVIERNQEIEEAKKRRKELDRIDRDMRGLQHQLESEPVEFDPREFNARSREKASELTELHHQTSDVRSRQNDIKLRTQGKIGELNEGKDNLRNLQSQSGQQVAKLDKLSKDSARAWKWLQNNRHRFSGTVYGPPIVELSVKDPRYAAAVESLFGRGDLVCFTTTNSADWKLLQDLLQKAEGLRDVHTRVASKPLSQFPHLLSKEELNEYGLDEWAVDLLQGPEPVLAMLCDTIRLNRTGVTLNDSTDAQFASLKDSPIANWVAGKNSFKVTRRREYGPNAVNTMVNPIRPASHWTSSGVDADAVKQSHAAIRDIERDLASLEEENEPIRQELIDIKEKRDALEREKKEIEEEKNRLQKAYSAWQMLPMKIETLKEKRESIRKLQDEVNDRLTEIAQRSTDLTLKRAQAAIDHAIALDMSMKNHEELVELELRLIESQSELEHFQKNSEDVRNMLRQREADLKRLDEGIRKQRNDCKVLVAQITVGQNALASMENGEEIGDIMNEWLNPGQNEDGDDEEGEDAQEPRTIEQLEADLDACRQRISLLHEGNPQVLRQFEERKRAIAKAKEQIENFEGNLEALNEAISQTRQRWEPALDELVENISSAFSHNFERIGCAGQVSVYKDEEDFREWAIEIKVKFRESEELAILDSHRQSGGERAVSTIFYLMALQSMAQSPFRVVDEINQGMDPRNERMVHERMVDIACEENTSQYFLVTPKLLAGLKYHERMVVHIIYSGEEMPASEGAGAGTGALDFRALAEIAARVRVR